MVIGYHTFPSLFKSGFIGVDIFFVISGFLISSIIFGSLDRRNFSYKEFYVRRIKRIFPALLLVLIACLILGNFYLLTDEYKTLGKNIAAGTTYISNFATWAEAGYFDTANYSKPLLHLWSLAIEEQFYIFWPLLLGFLWKMEKKQHFLLITLVMGICSFYINISTVGTNPTAAFYSPLSRFWELMVGGLLAYVSVFRPWYLEYKSNTRSIIGSILIIFGLFFINPDVAYPGWWALLPTVGTFFLISAGSDAWLNQNVLSNFFVVWIGLISYPLYLWHWPLLSFARIIFGQNLSVKMIMGVIAVSFILSWLAYKFIEKPIRSTKHVRRTILSLLSSMFIICFFGLLTVKTYGFPSRPINNEQHLYNASLHKHIKIPLFGTVFADESCENILEKQLVAGEGCHVNSASPQLLFGGDSHASALYSSIQSGKINVPALLINLSNGCAFYAHVKGINRDCFNVVDDFISTASMPSIKYIFIVNTSDYVANPKNNSVYTYNNKKLTEEEAFLIGYSNLLSDLSKLNKNIIFVLDVPHLPVSPKDCVQRSKLEDNSKKDCGIDFDTFQTNRLEYLERVSQLKKNIQN